MSEKARTASGYAAAPCSPPVIVRAHASAMSGSWIPMPTDRAYIDADRTRPMMAPRSTIETTGAGRTRRSRSQVKSDSQRMRPTGMRLSVEASRSIPSPVPGTVVERLPMVATIPSGT